VTIHGTLDSKAFVARRSRRSAGRQPAQPSANTTITRSRSASERPLSTPYHRCAILVKTCSTYDEKKTTCRSTSYARKTEPWDQAVRQDKRKTLAAQPVTDSRTSGLLAPQSEVDQVKSALWSVCLSKVWWTVILYTQRKTNSRRTDTNSVPTAIEGSHRRV